MNKSIIDSILSLKEKIVSEWFNKISQNFETPAPQFLVEFAHYFLQDIIDSSSHDKNLFSIKNSLSYKNISQLSLEINKANFPLHKVIWLTYDLNEVLIQSLSSNQEFNFSNKEELRTLTHQIALSFTQELSKDFKKQMDLQEDFSFMFNSMKDFVAFIGPDLRYEYVNSKYEDFMERTKEEIVGKPVKDVLKPSTYKTSIIHLQKALDGEASQAYVKAFGPNNQARKLEVKYTPYISKTGTVRGIFVLGFDITERIKMERKLYESEKLFRSTVNSLPQLAWIADKNGWISWYNDRWYDYTGTTLEEMQGWGWEKVHHPEHIDRIKKRIQHSWDTGEPWEDTFPLRGKDGQYRWFLSRALPVRDHNDEISIWVGTNTDVTEAQEAEILLKKAKESAEKAANSKSEFLANMSHEIRTPMNAILGFSELLKDPTHLPEEKDDFIERIQKSGNYLLNIIDDVLNLSKYEAGELHIVKEPFNFIKNLTEVVDTFKPLAKEKGLEIQLIHDQESPIYLINDSFRLNQVLTNIINNALKFTHQGGVKIHSYRDQEKIYIEIEDTGIGVSSEQKNQLFEPFKQADSTRSREYGGTGLGLTISKKIMHALNGEITLLKSEPNKGTTFLLQLPAETTTFALKRNKGQKNTSQKLQGFSLRGKRLLLAEDTPENVRLVQIFLRSEGMSITLATNGKEAIELASKEDFDLILMDIQMPILDGLQATQELVKNGFKKPIIAFTAHALSEEVERSYKAGCVSHITKPISKDSLVEIIRSVLVQHSEDNAYSKATT